MPQHFNNIAILNFTDRRQSICVLQLLTIKVKAQVFLAWVVAWSIIIKNLPQWCASFDLINNLLIMLILHLDADLLIICLRNCGLHILVITWHLNILTIYNNGRHESLASALFRDLWYAFDHMCGFNSGGTRVTACYHRFLYTCFWCHINYYHMCA